MISSSISFSISILSSYQYLSRQASIDGFQLNEAMCKELRIGFSNNTHDFEPLVLNGKPLELVTSPKLLGMIITHGSPRFKVEHAHCLK